MLKFTESQTIAVQTGAALDLASPWLKKKTARRAVLEALKRYRPRSGRR
jgi:hypothetical protein